MVQHLFLLRHAEPEPWNPLGNDFSRPLNATGKRHAELLADWAKESLDPPDTILCSPAKRTRETLAPFLSHWRKLLANTEYADSMYGASLNMLTTLAEDAFSYCDRLLMVGHNPGISLFLASVLKPGQAGEARQMSTGTFVVVEFSTGFKREARGGELRHLLGHEDLSVN
jgi:phosphohistidine phosphatase